MIDRKIFSKRFNIIKEERKVTMVDVAKALKITKQSVHKWTTGENIPSADTLVALVDYFGVPVDYLTGNGLFAKYERIIENRDVLIDTLAKMYPSLTIGDKSLINILRIAPDISFVQILDALMADIKFNPRTDEPVTISLFPFIPFS